MYLNNIYNIFKTPENTQQYLYQTINLDLKSVLLSSLIELIYYNHASSFIYYFIDLIMLQNFFSTSYEAS